jgi:cytochrome d ubiquinol oxidase subunit II
MPAELTDQFWPQAATLDQWLPLIWAGIAALAVVMYVLMDGFDLGIGILFPGAPDEEARDTMMNSVAPVWDGNETWLVLGGTGLFGAFPLAYATILPALYMPLILMLIALIFRGVSFEFRFKANRSKVVWDKAFHYGSLLATFAQGVVLGAYVRGIPVFDRQYAGGPFDWLSPFALFVGLALVAGYGLLGATWIVMKTRGDLQHWARIQAKRLLLAVLACMAVVSVWMPLIEDDVAARWFSWPNLLILSPIPILTGLTAGGILWALARRWDRAPFVLSMAMFALGFLGLAVSYWPFVVPHEITIWEAASPPSSQLFLLVGVGALIPVVLGYTGYVYWVFRGKVDADAGYH